MSLIRKVFGNLALDFGLLLFLAVLVTVLSMIGLQKVSADYQRVVNHSFEIERLAAKVAIDLLSAVNLEEQFFAQLEQEGFETAYENYIVPHTEYTDNLDQDVEALYALMAGHQVLGDDKIQENLKKISEDIELYEKKFSHLLDNVARRGTLESGLEGSFRQRATDVEEMILEHKWYDDLYNALLVLRVQEEEYLLRRSPETAEGVILSYQELLNEVDKANIPTQKKAEIAYQLEFYDQEFLEVVSIDAKIEEDHHEIQTLVKNINHLADEIDKIARREVMYDVDDANLIATKTTQLVIMSVVVVSIFGFGLMIAMSYQLRHEGAK